MSQPICRLFKKSRNLKNKSIKTISASDNSLGFRTRIIFDGQFSKQDKVTFDHKTLVKLILSMR